GAARRPGERTRIGELAAEVEPAHEAHELAERDAVGRAQPLREVGARTVIEQPPCPEAVTVRGGEEEDACHGAVVPDARGAVTGRRVAARGCRAARVAASRQPRTRYGWPRRVPNPTRKQAISHPAEESGILKRTAVD